MTIKVSIEKGRAYFSDSTKPDSKPESKNNPASGINAYRRISGLILEFFGFAKGIEIQGYKNKYLYLNTKSLDNWLTDHDIIRIKGKPFVYNQGSLTKTSVQQAVADVLSITELNKKIQENPQDTKALAECAALSNKYGNFPKAFEEITKALEIEPNNLEFLEKRIHYADSMIRSGGRIALIDRLNIPFDEAIFKDQLKELHMGLIRDYTQIYNIDPNRLIDNKNILVERAFCYELIQDYLSAIKDLEHYFKNAPIDSSTSYALGRRANLYFKNKDCEKALADINRLFKITPPKAVDAVNGFLKTIRPEGRETLKPVHNLHDVLVYGCDATRIKHACIEALKK